MLKFILKVNIYNNLEILGYSIVDGNWSLIDNLYIKGSHITIRNTIINNLFISSFPNGSIDIYNSIIKGYISVSDGYLNIHESEILISEITDKPLFDLTNSSINLANSVIDININNISEPIVKLHDDISAIYLNNVFSNIDIVRQTPIKSAIDYVQKHNLSVKSISLSNEIYQNLHYIGV